MASYRAKLEPDGFYSILGVPVFSEVPKGVKGAPFDIDKAWLDAALAKSRQREKEGYLAPLHFEHHGGPERSFKAGHYRLTRVGRVTVGGEKRWALFADLVKMPAHAFAAIMAGEWPYRSVEIVRYQTFEIESVALLDDETPFHKFELLNSDSIEVEEDAASPEAILTGPVAFAKTEHGFAGLFRYAETPMKIKIVAKDDKWIALDEKGKAPEIFSGVELSVDQPEASFESDKLPEDPKTLRKMAAAIAAKLKKLAASEDDEGKETPPEPEKDRGMKGKALDPEFAARFDRMESDLATFKAEKAAASLTTKYVDLVKSKGYHVGETTRQSIEFRSAEGEESVKRWVEDYMRFAKKDGPEDLGDDEDEADDPVLAKFSNLTEDGRAALETANAHWRNLVSAGMRRDDDKARAIFLSRELALKGFKVA